MPVPGHQPTCPLVVAHHVRHLAATLQRVQSRSDRAPERRVAGRGAAAGIQHHHVRGLGAQPGSDLLHLRRVAGRVVESAVGQGREHPASPYGTGYGEYQAGGQHQPPRSDHR